MEINDIDEIKNDISSIKNSIDTLSLEFKKHIQEHLITSSVAQNSSVSTTVLDNSENKSNVSITASNLDTYTVENPTKRIVTYDNKSIDNDLIGYSFIDNNSKNKLLIEIICNSNKNMRSLYQTSFLEFCRCAVGLVEDVIKIFLEKKFFEENNDQLLKACNLLEKKYLEKKPKAWNFPNIYIPNHEYNPHKVNTDDYYYISNKEAHLSLPKLKAGNISFTLELCFITLYGEDFYKTTDTKSSIINVQTSNKALKRPSAKLSYSLEPLNKKFYSRINNARDFRNIFAHNPNNEEAQQNELQEKVSRYKKLADDLNNYDGILEAVTWFIRQMYFDMTK
ncbi:hypothetical protein [Nostoc sp.]|uniref:hypothetical protein n=1 Tax=Nostoc sp. TaxID=1180 RepID=UPI002FF01749